MHVGKTTRIFHLLFTIPLFVGSGTANDTGRIISSTCNEDTDWNYKNVGAALKKWILSIEALEQKNPWNLMVNFYEQPTRTGLKLNFIAEIDDEGEMSGKTWQAGAYNETATFNNGFYYGNLEPGIGDWTGDNIAFIYPDMETAFLGSFKKFEMVAARATKIVAERCENNIKKLKFAAPKSDDEPIFRYERPNRLRLGDQPLVMDPYEKKTVYVQDLEQEGEQGLFAKRDIAEGEQIAFYSGVIFDDRDHTTITPNMTEEEIEEQFRHLMLLLPPATLINLPGETSELHRYRATLGHKVNHSFKHANAEYNSAFHMRFGFIRGVLAAKDIKKGEQILIDYKYQLDGTEPKWYQKLHLKEVGPLPELTKWQKMFAKGVTATSVTVN